ncbi:MAG: fibronectin type III domain-containing protein [Owenweeksia sp.]|nr:fibronectin type III domain-containing protein [Owenweeksia sp.]
MPGSLNAANFTTTSADLSWVANASSSSGTDFEISYGSSLSNPLSGTRTVVTGQSFNLTGLMPSSGYCFYVREICAPGDTSFWAGPYCFSTSCATVAAPYTEDFEAHTVGHYDGTGNCWDFSSNNPSTTGSGGYSWEVRNSSQTTSGISTGPDRDNTLFPNIGGKFITADVSGSTTTGPDSTLLVSPIIDISALSVPELEYHMHRYGATMADLYVDIYDGTNWVRGVHSHINLNGMQTAQADPWTDTIVDLAPYAGINNLQVRFRSVTNGCCDGDNAIDDISIYDANPSGCPLPTNLATSSIGCDSVSLTWNSTSGSSVLLYGPAGFTPPNGTFSGIVSSPYTITGLSSGTSYDVYVADTCANDTSLIVGPFNFSTTGGVVSASFTSTLGTVTATDRNVFL